MQNLQRNIRHTIVYLIPFLWFIIFLLVPFLFVVGISFTLPADGTPPVTALLNYKDQTLYFTFYLKNYIELIHYNLIFVSLFNSLKVAFITTILCILIGYPMALALSRAKKNTQIIFLILIIIPYWTSFLLRTYAWVTLLGNHTLNKFLMDLGLPSMALLYNDFSMYLGMVYCYLPFLVLPLYSTLIKIDPILYDAAEDLGSKPINSFFKITLPLSMPGLIAGSLLIFIPAVGEVVVPQIMGGMNSLMIGNIIWEEFFTSNNWGMAATISVVLILILVLPILWMQRIQTKKTFV
ncbi:ABC transporter permease subunit [Allofrancisella guangzhouensis]|uniref:Spermidine/putrescine ABC transporter permease n=1 Tax=Allofrancisella guangzhouensis TaxID=594679 RepID=A0A0A8E4S3_9GAMM|nr:ABC transporter permease subunit [Allofrancisella guangzhouensis]AJC49235.1 spermidine/putrescine ABC transporter permease [Allofrancisella guangzhouensis]MBK2027673.1 ABC transporter permease subunit [Allofrancisella guangzhouensis]MBK2044913.1 ABC transporter permease subunit [Allofrancisella guangzhouensis]MBK2046438.1 ABC transporter permease subunit [Allofrancisella guangzhouensis]